MTINYKVLIDWNQDGAFCTAAQPSDPLNLIITPVTYAYIPVEDYLGGSLTETVETTAYGRKLWTVETVGTGGKGMIFGGDGRIPVTTNATYTAVAWVRNLSGFPGDNAALAIFDQADASITVTASASSITVGQWVRVYSTFTTGIDTTSIQIAVRRTNSPFGLPSGTYEMDVAGLMLVDGSTPPEAYNAGASSDPYEDVTSYVTGMIQFQHGMTEYPQDFAPPARAMITLSNASGVFTPENAASPLFGGMRLGSMVRITATTGELVIDPLGGIVSDTRIDYVLWTGTISRYQVALGALDTVTILAECAMLQFLDAEYAPQLQTSVRTDEVLTAFFDSGAVPCPYPTNSLMLDVGQLDQNYLYENTITAFDEGATTVPYAGDTAGTDQGVSAQGYLRDAVSAELGARFFWDAPRSLFVFHSRHHDAINSDTAVEIAETDILFSPSPPTYVYGADVANAIEVTFEPRRVAETTQIIYTLDNPRSVRAGETVMMTVRYHDPDDDRIRVAALTVNQPMPGTDYTAATDANYEGVSNDDPENVTELVTVSVNPSAQSADVSIYNPTDDTIYLTQLQLIGTAIYTLPRETVRARDAGSIARHGLRARVVDIPMIDTSSAAQAFADYLLLTSKDAAGRLVSISAEISSDETRANKLLPVSIGDPVAVEISPLSADRAEVVTGIRHAINIAAGSHVLTFYLAPAGRVAFGILDDTVRGLLDSTMRIAV